MSVFLPSSPSTLFNSMRKSSCDCMPIGSPKPSWPTGPLHFSFRPPSSHGSSNSTVVTYHGGISFCRFCPSAGRFTTECGNAKHRLTPQWLSEALQRRIGWHPSQPISSTIGWLDLVSPPLLLVCAEVAAVATAIAIPAALAATGQRFDTRSQRNASLQGIEQGKSTVVTVGGRSEMKVLIAKTSITTIISITHSRTERFKRPHASSNLPSIEPESP